MITMITMIMVVISELVMPYLSQQGVRLFIPSVNDQL